MSIAQSIVLRHREPGYLRFDVPRSLCAPEASEALSRGLSSLDGVYRVGLKHNSGKLTIRFHDAFCSFERLIRTLYDLVRRIAVSNISPPPSTSRTIVPAGPRKTLPQRSPSQYAKAVWRWLETKIRELRETIHALRILLKRFLGNRPRWTKEFMNDLLMLFLIKLHWHQILTEWLPSPWTYRYEWMATIYMIYLSVQAKVPQTI